MNEQAVLRLAVEAARGIAADDFDERGFVEQLAELFDADAGVGLTTVRVSSAGARIHVVVGGATPFRDELAAAAEPFAATHPGFVAMKRVGTRASVRLSDEIALAPFWDTESWQAMHGHSDGRYPLAARCYCDDDVEIFLGLHRRARDFTDDEVTWLSRLQQPLASAYRYRATLTETLQHLHADGTPACGDNPSAALFEWSRPMRPTPRETEVLSWMTSGLTNTQIASRMHITERTVRKHLSAVYEKAGLSGRAAAAAWWAHQSDH